MFRSGDYMQMMNRASALSLVSNALVLSNTRVIERVLAEAARGGRPFTAAEIAHVSPRHYRHVIAGGTYDFTVRSREKQLDV